MTKFVTHFVFALFEVAKLCSMFVKTYGSFREGQPLPYDRKLYYHRYSAVFALLLLCFVRLLCSKSLHGFVQNVQAGADGVVVDDAI